jgi:prevent-host-death family protein
MVQENLGVREVKARLSSLLKKVREGQEIIITDRGKPIGKIVPFPNKSLSLEDRIERLENRDYWSHYPNNAPNGSHPHSLPLRVWRKNISRRKETGER